ncbi:MAG: hypothetical protein LQ338_000676 [Usnochroma carphineum]|nr:MAG: hypothetical protein LQ338_000676 [Usnochroma carphineum]
MRYIITAIAVLVTLTMASPLPHELRTRDVPVQAASMTDGQGNVVPFDAAGVQTTA